ncbi:MAG: hypothetical protein U0U67_08480 [Chitinophagales bacterium]
MQKILFLVLCFAFLANGKLLAQEENYQSIKVTDTLNEVRDRYDERKEERAEIKKLSKQEESARTAMEKKKEMLNRFRIGINDISIQIGAITTLSMSATVGYMVVKNRLELGAGPLFLYQRVKYTNGYTESNFVYGGAFYARGFLYKGINLEARYVLANRPSYYDASQRVNVNHLLLGAGYVQPIAKIAYFNVSALFNVINSKQSLYQGTFSSNFPLIINLGFSFSLGGKD